jgi:hypothetical protein
VFTQFFKDRREEKKTPILEIEKIQITKLQYFSTGVLTSYFLRINKISGEGIAKDVMDSLTRRLTPGWTTRGIIGYRDRIDKEILC